MTEQGFDKYKRSGAYHWTQADPSPLNRSFNAPLVARYHLMVSALPPTATTLLDAGCGDGYLLFCISRSHPRMNLWGIDILPESLMLARSKLVAQHCTAQLVTGSVCTLPFQSSSFEVVCMADVIEHLQEPVEALAEARRVLKSNGVLVLSTPHRQPDRIWDTCHVQELAAHELEALCKRCFTHVSIIACWPMVLFRAWQRNRVMRAAMNRLARQGYNLFTLHSRWALHAFGQLIARCSL